MLDTKENSKDSMNSAPQVPVKAATTKSVPAPDVIIPPSVQVPEQMRLQFGQFGLDSNGPHFGSFGTFGENGEPDDKAAPPPGLSSSAKTDEASTKADSADTGFGFGFDPSKDFHMMQQYYDNPNTKQPTKDQAKPPPPSIQHIPLAPNTKQSQGSAEPPQAAAAQVQAQKPPPAQPPQAQSAPPPLTQQQSQSQQLGAPKGNQGGGHVKPHHMKSGPGPHAGGHHGGMAHGNSGPPTQQHYQQHHPQPNAMQPPTAMHHQQPMPTMLPGMPPGMGYYPYAAYHFAPSAYAPYMHNMHNAYYAAGPGAGYPPQAGNVTNAPNQYMANVGFTPPGYNTGGAQPGSSGSGGKMKPTSSQPNPGQGSSYQNSRNANDDIYANGSGTASGGSGGSKDGQAAPPSGFSTGVPSAKDSTQGSAAPPSSAPPPGYYSQNVSSSHGYSHQGMPTSQPNGHNGSYGQAQQHYAQQYGAQNQYMQYGMPPNMAANGGSQPPQQSGGYKLGI